MPAGRPSKFEPKFCEQAEKLARLGVTDAEMADVFGVAESTLSLWKNEHPEFSEALKRGKIQADVLVAERLFIRATGYEHPAVKIFYDKDKGPVEVPYVERYPPDTTAAIFWLKNRRKAEWRDKQDVELAGPEGGPVQVEDVTDSMRARRLALLLAKSHAETGEGP